jgi:hypothetical protein
MMSEEELIRAKGHWASAEFNIWFPSCARSEGISFLLHGDAHTGSSSRMYNFGSPLESTTTGLVPSRCSMASTIFPEAAIRVHISLSGGGAVSDHDDTTPFDTRTCRWCDRRQAHAKR